MSEPLREVRLCFVGKTGVGKSALANLMCPGANFATSSSAASVTFASQQATIDYPESGLSLILLDTMGMGDTGHTIEVVRQKITEGMRSLVGGVDFFFLCIKKERFTDENYLIVKYALPRSSSLSLSPQKLTWIMNDVLLPSSGTCSRPYSAKGPWPTCGSW